MSSKHITLLKTADTAETVGKVLKGVAGAGKKVLTTSGRMGAGIARGMGGGQVAQGLGTAAGVAAPLVAGTVLARKTRVGRRIERGAGQMMGAAGRAGERAMTPGDWGSYQGEDG